MKHAEYEKMSAIGKKLQTGKPTTFAERNWYMIKQKELRKKKKS